MSWQQGITRIVDVPWRPALPDLQSWAVAHGLEPFYQTDEGVVHADYSLPRSQARFRRSAYDLARDAYWDAHGARKAATNFGHSGRGADPPPPQRKPKRNITYSAARVAQVRARGTETVELPAMG